MTAPSPTPTEIAKPMPQIAKCPACKVNGLDSTCTVLDGVVSCNWCIYQCGVTTSEPMQPYDDEEAVIIHNALCAPALAPFEKLVEEWRADAKTLRGSTASEENATVVLTVVSRAIQWDECADRLSAVVEEVRGK